MKNWKHYVGFQPVGEHQKLAQESDEEFTERMKNIAGFQVFVLKVKENEENPNGTKTLSIAIEKQVIDKESFVYTEDEIGSAVESIISEFPVYENWEKFNGVNKKTWHFGFGPYYNNVDGNKVYNKNYITIKLPVILFEDKDSEKLLYVKEMSKDFYNAEIANSDFEAKYDIPKEDARWLVEESKRKIGWLPYNIHLPYICTETTKDKFNILQWERIKNQIAKQSRRGMANIRAKIENLSVSYYKGATPYDSPIIVSEYEGKYAIIKHPDFDKYGFVVEND